MEIWLDDTLSVICIEIKNAWKLLFRKHNVYVLKEEDINRLRALIKQYDVCKNMGGITLRQLHACP